MTPLLFERPVPSLTLSAPGKAAISLFMGVAFIAGHTLATGGAGSSDWSWMLGVILTSSMLTLYYATHSFRRLCTRMSCLVPPQRQRAFDDRLRRAVSNRVMLAGGLSFGVINCLMAAAFGIAYAAPLGLATFYGGVFAAGFSCGMAVSGIYGVVRVVSSFAREMEPQVDFAAPDRCGGLLFVGHALLKFSLVTLFVGVLIAVYVLNAPWVNRGDAVVAGLMWFWAVFPFVASLFVLLSPAVEVHGFLEAFKVSEERELRKDMMEMRRRLRDDSTPHDQRAALREEYDYQVQLRRDLHRMRTWPFDPVMGTEYMGIFAGHAAVIWQYLQRLVSLAA